MRWACWLVIGLALLNGGWMAFDGARALIVGDYVTPTTGEYAGRLGPWAGVVEAAGLAPRSTPVKLAFVAYGSTLVLLAAALAARAPWARRALLFAAPLGLWYLPFGTIATVFIIVLLLTALRPGAGSSKSTL